MAFATIVAVVAGLVLASASAMAHDIYVGAIKGDHATPEEQVRAARISSVIVGIVAIIIGISAKGQNVAHLVAMAFAVAASSNLPAVFLTLYWKKCNTNGVVWGMLIGAFSAIALVMISPNMTYPQAVIKDAKAVLEGTPAKEAVEAKASEGFVCELFAVCQPGLEPIVGALSSECSVRNEASENCFGSNVSASSHRSSRVSSAVIGDDDATLKQNSVLRPRMPELTCCRTACRRPSVWNGESAGVR